MQLWDVLEGTKLFKVNGENNDEEYDDQRHLALITGLLGPPPRQLLADGKRTPLFYDPTGMQKLLTSRSD